MALNALPGLPIPSSLPSGTSRPGAMPGADAASTFSHALTGLLTSVERSSADANVAVSDMLTGQGDVHEAMITLQRAEMSLELTVQVRNKLAQAYQDVMRMPI
jgi:flagellar hook-basal body complex protein FliE